MTHKNRKKLRNFMCWTGRSLLRAEGFFCSLEALYGGLGISKLHSIKIKFLSHFFPGVNFFTFLSRNRIRIGIQPKMLDPDPETKHPDP